MASSSTSAAAGVNPRFEQIFAILLERYGTRFVRLHPTEDSLCWLYGDSLSAGSRIDRLNESLRKHLR